MNITNNNPVDHIFICEGNQVFNDMFPFFQALCNKNALFFSDTTNESVLKTHGVYPLSRINELTFSNTRAIVYLSFPRHYKTYVRDGILNAYNKVKIVRLYHGITGPWARALDPSFDFLDVVVATSNLDAEVWQRNSKHRVETIGWPKGEQFLHDNQNEEVFEDKIVISSSWSIEKADFRICNRLNELSNYRITFTLHPLLVKPGKSPRQIDSGIVKKILKKLRASNINVVDCRDGILEHMRGRQLMLSAISSAAFEWLLFNRPILFLRNHPVLDFGPTLDFSRPLSPQLSRSPCTKYLEQRENLRRKLTSHFDGRWATRFNDLVQELEKEIM